MLKWKQIVIPTLYSYTDPNTRIEITKLFLFDKK